MVDWTLSKAERGVLLGRTGTGKSTLGTELIRRFLDEYKKARVLIIDSKPRFRASYDLSGNRLSYSGWVDGDMLAESVAIHSGHEGVLKQAFKWGRVAVLQSMTTKSAVVPGFLEAVAQQSANLFRLSRKDSPTLLYVDEMYDLTGGGLAAQLDSRILQTIRAGRERNMGVLSAAQRPRSIPLPVLTEAGKYYIFELTFKEDIKYLSNHVAGLDLAPSGHQFAFYNQTAKREKQMMELELTR